MTREGRECLGSRPRTWGPRTCYPFWSWGLNQRHSDARSQTFTGRRRSGSETYTILGTGRLTGDLGSMPIVRLPWYSTFPTIVRCWCRGPQWQSGAAKPATLVEFTRSTPWHDAVCLRRGSMKLHGQHHRGPASHLHICTSMDTVSRTCPLAVIDVGLACLGSNPCIGLWMTASDPQQPAAISLRPSCQVPVTQHRELRPRTDQAGGRAALRDASSHLSSLRN
ncbi:hypothetical protein LX32DRAFT_120809 [Colletotrichum zoysiae]|uniref:Uncharacterized protein n=1 Tax=Colletotrichum zoysiae TaxID=1216348 RepID=A0AAD9LX36_9PEZI|nr:hypothetical protein LX32DRAFT_120809 [Colletotrichum zoysiae]